MTITKSEQGYYCKICGEEKQRATMQIVPVDCWSCGSPMKMALILVSGTWLGPEAFTSDQIELARSKSVVIQEQFSKTSESKYFANTCPNCKNFIGEFFIHEYLYLPAEDIDLGFVCGKCALKNIENLI
ncbi:MAG: hypothetical protein M1383_06360 [Patescibacteria group bacterium]|nr:hypothetical protein [Patescibacteria group bacterium]